MSGRRPWLIIMAQYTPAAVAGIGSRLYFASGRPAAGAARERRRRRQQGRESAEALSQAVTGPPA